MGKRDTQQALTDVKTDQSQAKTTGVQNQTQNDNETQQAGAPLSADREGLDSTYSGLASGTNAPPKIGEVSQTVDKSQYQPIMSGYMGLAGNGGYSDASKASIGGDISGLQSIGATGGIDAAGAARMRGGGVYDDFAQTGGLSQSDRANIKARALSPVSSMASTTRDEMARRRSVQGGFSPGFDASTRALQRDTARNIADTDLSANLGITDQVNQNKLAGAAGMASTEGNYQGLKTGNQLTGLTGAANTEMGLNNSIAGNQLSALGGANATANGMANVDNMNANIGFGNANIQGQNINNQLNQQNLGVSGMQGLYSSDASRYASDLDRNVGITGQNASSNQGYYAARNPLATQPGVGGNVMSLAGTAAGIGGGLISGSMKPQYTGNQYMNVAQ